ncbi:hypothetical protein ABIB25_002075 [Nakamurella sp. UYEF19]
MVTNPATVGGSVPCWQCNAAVTRGAAFCPACGRAALSGCAAVLRVGKVYVIGRYVDGGFAVWDQTIATPVSRYASSDWPKANEDLDRAETDGGPPGPSWWRHWLGRIATSLALLVLVVVYLYVHLRTFDDCLITPGPFSWPSRLEAICVSG